MKEQGDGEMGVCWELMNPQGKDRWRRVSRDGEMDVSCDG